MTSTLPRKAALITLILTAVLAVAALGLAQSGRRAHYDRIPKGAYAVVAEVRAKPGKADELRKVTLPLVAQVRSEPNNLLYFLHEDRQTPGTFVFYEIFVSKADFDAHNVTPHVKAWFAELPELAEGGVKVTRMEILPR